MVDNRQDQGRGSGPSHRTLLRRASHWILVQPIFRGSPTTLSRSPSSPLSPCSSSSPSSGFDAFCDNEGQKDLGDSLGFVSTRATETATEVSLRWPQMGFTFCLSTLVSRDEVMSSSSRLMASPCCSGATAHPRRRILGRSGRECACSIEVFTNIQALTAPCALTKQKSVEHAFHLLLCLVGWVGIVASLYVWNTTNATDMRNAVINT